MDNPETASSNDQVNPPTLSGGASFEERLQELNSLADRLKDGEIPVPAAVNLFERGMILARQLGTDLEKIERRIEIMINEPEDEEQPPKLKRISEKESESLGGGS